MDQRLLEQLKHPDPRARQQAIIALGKAGDPAALRYIAAVYKQDPDPEVRKVAAKVGKRLQQLGRAAQQPRRRVLVTDWPPPDPDPLNFRFVYVDENGKPKRGKPRKAVASLDDLRLHKAQLQYTLFFNTLITRGDQIFLVLPATYDMRRLPRGVTVHGFVIGIQIHDVDALQVKYYIDRCIAQRIVAVQRKQLKDRGDLGSFRAARCPVCEALTSLIDVPEARYIYCDSCNAVFQPDGAVISEGLSYCHCLECGLWAHGDFRQAFGCDGCQGIEDGNAANKLLTRVNEMVKAGRMDATDGLFDKLHERWPDHPGLMVNEAEGYFNAGMMREAALCCTDALTACPTYVPAVKLMQKIEGK